MTVLLSGMTVQLLWLQAGLCKRHEQMPQGELLDSLVWVEVQEDVRSPGVQVNRHQGLIRCLEVLDALRAGRASEFALQVCMHHTMSSQHPHPPVGCNRYLNMASASHA